MVNLMVVEDEPAILLGVVQLIKNLDLPITVVASCTNGAMALKRLEDVSVDLVITDIRMPVMNGLKLIEEAKKQYPDIEFIVLSGYSEFEYARTALRFGVGDYILKPPKQEETYSVLKKLCEKIEEQKKKRDYQIIESIIFSENYDAGMDIMERFKDKYCYLLFACAGPYSAWAESLIRPDGAIWDREHIEKQLGSKLGGHCTYYVFDAKLGNEKLIFLASEEEAIIPVKQLVNQLARYERLLDLPISIVLSERFSDIKEARSVYRKLRLSMGNSVIIGKSHMVMLDDKNTIENYIAIDNNERSNIQKFIEKDDFKSLVQVFNQLCQRWKKEKTSQANCEFSVKYLISEIYRNYNELKKEYSIEELLGRVEEVIGTSVSFEQFNLGIVEIIEDINRKVRGIKSNLKIDDVVELFYELITNNYAQDISIEQFAGQFGYNPTYVANMFTAIKKISPNKLVIQFRMNKAKELLKESDYLLKDIAAMIGYNDVSYFSRIFKEVTGESPKQFREKEAP
ncbi:MAG TPA: response regulator [Clostridiales bacterium]|nr:response regulator [Clostridiales bacterium]